MGRNIWQSDHPVAMIKAIRAIVHNNSDTEGAYDIFLKEKEKETQQHRIIKSVD
jgi:putative autoinducer-2 (AI-2) aldolase